MMTLQDSHQTSIHLSVSLICLETIKIKQCYVVFYFKIVPWAQLCLVDLIQYYIYLWCTTLVRTLPLTRAHLSGLDRLQLQSISGQPSIGCQCKGHHSSHYKSCNINSIFVLSFQQLCQNSVPEICHKYTLHYTLFNIKLNM